MLEVFILLLNYFQHKLYLLQFLKEKFYQPPLKETPNTTSTPLNTIKYHLPIKLSTLHEAPTNKPIIKTPLSKYN